LQFGALRLAKSKYCTGGGGGGGGRAPGDSHCDPPDRDPRIAIAAVVTAPMQFADVPGYL